MVLLASIILFSPIPSMASAPEEHRVRIEASSFSYAPNVVEINPGDRVTIELVSTDYVHGFYLDGYDLELTADPGQTARLSFRADRLGTFRFRCSVTCGALHPFMVGKVKVGTNNLLWRGIGLAVIVALAGIFWKSRP
jgi:heme/copper-type cytochrome/quinol oxidase subunit 2